jgi:hypothetical protein
MPQYWTSFDDGVLVFDSYDSSLDSTLQTSKTLVLTTSLPDFEQTDDYIPDIDDNLFPLLINEAKAMAHVELKQQAHPKAEADARKQTVRYQTETDKFNRADTTPNYGRK